MAQEWGSQRALHAGHLNSLLKLEDGNLTVKNRKVQMAGVCPGGAAC